MRIDFAFPALPPALNGVGDHTALTARLMAESGHEVRILCATGPHALVSGVTVVPCMTGCLPWTARKLAPAVKAAAPDWLILQYASFAWGRWGLNPLLERLVRSVAPTRVALLCHENYPPGGTFRATLMSLAQRRQLRSLGRGSDLVLFTTEGWVDAYTPWFPATPVGHAPIGSNLPASSLDREQARARLGLRPADLVIGLFGALGNGRNERVLVAGLTAAASSNSRTVALYVGSTAEQFRRLAPTDLDDVVIVEGADAAAAAAAFSAMDLALAPYVGGVSMRRTSFMAGLQHGVASVATGGPLVGPVLKAAADAGVFALADAEDPASFAGEVGRLCSDRASRQAMGLTAKEFYSGHLSAERATQALLGRLLSAQAVGSTA